MVENEQQQDKKVSFRTGGRQKEFIHITEGQQKPGHGVSMPVMLLFIFGYGITMDIKSLNMGIYDMDKTAESRELIEIQGIRLF